MIVQIYTMQTPEEARAIAALGVQHLGVTPAQHNLPGEVDYETAREILAVVPNGATRVALSVDSDPTEILAMVRVVQPDILHLCGLEDSLAPEAVHALRAQIYPIKIMQAISVAGPEALAKARTYHTLADYLILDTQAPDIDGIGASGQTHDWSISAQIVRESPIPVILAGGLSPENVAEAIRVVRPWGVDSLTHTNQPLPDGGFRKDLDRVHAFVQAAQGA